MNKKLSVILIIIFVFACFYANSQTFKYVGANKCKLCHNTDKIGQQFKIWSETPHSKAFTELSSAKSLEYAKNNNIADPTKEPKCLKCHSTAASVDASLIASVTVEEGVTCETCHGAGSEYRYKEIMMDRKQSIKAGLVLPDKETCIKCHNEENPFFKPFDFDTYYQKIKHPIPGKN